jgi:hypothetical protein
MGREKSSPRDELQCAFEEGGQEMGALEIRTAEDRERLFQEVWNEPAETVAKRYGVSGVALARWCTKLEVPRPQRGYWAKKSAGKKVPLPPPLPEINKSLARHVRGYAVHWTDTDGMSDELLVDGGPLHLLTRESIETLNDYTSHLVVEGQLRSPDELASAIMQGLAEAREKRRTDRQDWHFGLTRQHWGRPASGKLWPFDLSPKNEKRALRVVDTLDKTLFKIEGRISESEKQYDSRGEVKHYIRVCALEDYFQLTFSEDASGRLALEAKEEHGGIAAWHLADRAGDPIEDHIGEMVHALCVQGDKRRGLTLMQHREWERELAAAERQRKLEQRRSLETKFRQDILECARGWDEARGLREFCDALSAYQQNMTDDGRRKLLAKVIEAVHSRADYADPFVESSDDAPGFSVDLWRVGEEYFAGLSKFENL